MLVDQFGRTINYLRLSVTDRCDFRCVYCMAEDMTFVPRQELLSLEEITTITQAFVNLGVNKVRLTGGEPLIRRNVAKLIQSLGEIEALDELTLTTNGSQLVQFAPILKQAGIKRINISLDSLKADRFKALTRTGELHTVLAGIDAALAQGLKVKLNTVILRQRNNDEVIDLVRFAIAKNVDISFIEEMPLGEISEHIRKEEFISSAELREHIQQHYPLHKNIHKKNNAGPSDYWTIGKHTNRIGFISPHSQNFCSDCNRVRLTATGKLLLCLGNEHSVDLREVIRQQPEKLEDTIINAMTIKPEKHEFDLDQAPQILRFMNTTGG